MLVIFTQSFAVKHGCLRFASHNYRSNCLALFYFYLFIGWLDFWKLFYKQSTLSFGIVGVTKLHFSLNLTTSNEKKKGHHTSRSLGWVVSGDCH